MDYGRTYNFSAGPSILPEDVLESVRDNLVNYEGSGMCVMEMSHRSKVFQKIIDEAEQDLRDLMNIPDNYKVLFIQGGATLQFAMIPMNLMKNGVYSLGFTQTKVEGKKVTYTLEYNPKKTGIFDMAIRIFPKNEKLAHRMDFALVKWA